jgi:hypothetical protein
MNGKTPEDRISAVARTLAYKMHSELGRVPDYADFRAGLRPYIRRELVLARIDEARTIGASNMTARIRILNGELMEIEKSMSGERSGDKK